MCAFLLICLADLPQNCGTYFYIWNLFNTTHGSFGNKVTAVILLIAHIQPDYIRYFCSQVQSYSTSVKVHLFDLILSLMLFFFLMQMGGRGHLVPVSGEGLSGSEESKVRPRPDHRHSPRRPGQPEGGALLPQEESPGGETAAKMKVTRG